MQTVFCSAHAAKLLSQFEQPRKFLETIIDFYPQNIEALKLVKKLLEENMLIELGSDELVLVRKIRKQILSKTKLITLYIVPTWECNLDCDYCHIHLMKKTVKTQMSEKILAKGLEYFIKHSSKNHVDKLIVFYGGEPLLNWPIIKKAICLAKSQEKRLNGKLNFAIFTNGTRITKEIASFFKTKGVFVIISIDGPKENHNAMRKCPFGKGTLQDVLKGYALCKKAGCKVGISTVVGKHNIDKLQSVISYIYDKLQPVDIGLSVLHSFPFGKNPAYVSPEKISKAFIDAFQMARERNIYIEHIMRRVRPFVEKKIRIRDCPSCGGKIIIGPKGKIGLCEAFLTQNKFLIDNELYTDSNYTKWKVRSQFWTDSCLYCPSISLCGGGCPYDAYVLTKSLNGLDIDKCKITNEILMWLMRDLARIIEKQILRQDFESNPFHYYVPTIEERRKLYGNIVNSLGPLSDYSAYGENNVSED